MGNGGSTSSASSSSKGTMTSAFLTSQHGASFVSTLLGGGKKGGGGGGKDAVLPDGTLLTWTNAADHYQRHVDLCAIAETRTREAQRGLDACLHFLAANVNEVLASEARQSFFELSAPALKELLKSDDLALGSEFVIYVLVGVWADRQVTLASGEEWSLPELAKRERDGEAAAETGDKAEAEAAADGEGKGENAGGQSQETEVEIPGWKWDQEYTIKLRDAMAPLLPHVRFPLMSIKNLAAIEAEGTLVPCSYITEAYRHKALLGTGVYTPDVKNNERVRSRRFETAAVWDPTWHGQNVAVSADGKTVTKTQSYWYCLAMGKEGYSSGRHSWAIKVGGDEAYIGIARKELTQLDKPGVYLMRVRLHNSYLGVDAYSWSFNNSAYVSSGASNNNRTFGESYGRGDVIGVVLDLVDMKLSFFKNGKSLGDAFTNLPSNVKLYPAVGWRDGTMSFVSANLDD